MVSRIICAESGVSRTLGDLYCVLRTVRVEVFGGPRGRVEMSHGVPGSLRSSASVGLWWVPAVLGLASFGEVGVSW